MCTEGSKYCTEDLEMRCDLIIKASLLPEPCQRIYLIYHSLIFSAPNQQSQIVTYRNNLIPALPPRTGTHSYEGYGGMYSGGYSPFGMSSMYGGYGSMYNSPMYGRNMEFQNRYENILRNTTFQPVGPLRLLKIPILTWIHL